jgi:predicted transcriptional regulator of viral defense system
MKLRDFETIIRPLLAFNLNDVRKIDPGFHRQQLYYWTQQGHITPLAGGYYRLAGQDVTEAYRFMLSNRIYSPSYISLESALAFHQVIPETALTVTAVSSRKTRVFTGEGGRFSYRSVKPELMFGYTVADVNGSVKFSMASLEKAVLDYLYLNPGILSLEDFEGLRWNSETVKNMDMDRINSYLRAFDSQALTRRIRVMKDYAHA